MLKHGFSLLLSLAVISCATKPTPLEKVVEIDPAKIYSLPVLSTDAHSTLNIIRDSGLHGIEHDIEIWIDGEYVADLNVKERLQVTIDVGPHIIEAKMFNVLGKIRPEQIETFLEKDVSYFYLVGLSDVLHLTRDMGLTK